MHTTIQVWTTTFIAFILLMMGLTFGLSIFSENHQQAAVNTAVQAALMDSRNDNSRNVRGVYAINQDKFENSLNKNGKYNSMIEHWRKKNFKNVRVKCFYLLDDSENAKRYTSLNQNPQSKHVAGEKEGIPVRGIKIMVLGTPKNGTKEKVLDTATYVVSVRVNLSPHNEDVSGDNVENNQLPQNVIQ